MKIKYLFYVLICISGLSCQDANKEVVDIWGNGNNKKVRVNEKAFSYETNYFEDGKVESKGIIAEEKKEKDWIYFYPNGKKKQEIIYREGKPFENAIYFYENGNVEKEAEYDETGLKTGYWKSYSETGKIVSKGSYSQGRKINKWSYYNLEGSLEREENLDNFGRNEFVNIYNQEGELVRHSEYYKPNGLKLEFYKMDSFSNKISYRSYHQNGNIEFEGVKLNSREIGLWTFWHRNGIKKAQGKFIENVDKFNHNNIVKVNYKISSKLPLQRTMSGFKIGKWEYWDNEGEKVAEIESKIKGKNIVDKLIYVNKDLLY